jgi:hypothetical protein
MHSIRTGHVHGTAASSFITELSVCTRVSQTKTLQAIKKLKTVPCAAADTASQRALEASTVWKLAIR